MSFWQDTSRRSWNTFSKKLTNQMKGPVKWKPVGTEDKYWGSGGGGNCETRINCFNIYLRNNGGLSMSPRRKRGRALEITLRDMNGNINCKIFIFSFRKLNILLKFIIWSITIPIPHTVAIPHQLNHCQGGTCKCNSPPEFCPAVTDSQKV